MLKAERRPQDELSSRRSRSTSSLQGNKVPPQRSRMHAVDVPCSGFFLTAPRLDCAPAFAVDAAMDEGPPPAPRWRPSSSSSLRRPSSQLPKPDPELVAAAEAASREQAVLAELSASVEQYVELHVASRVLELAIQRYRKKNQEPTLERANRIFRRLTAGAFEGLEFGVGSGERVVLLGRRSGDTGRPLSVDGMSDGTRDQLFLALRLASIEEYVDAHGPLPFIVDDILINSDDQRAEATLRELGELSEKVQVVFFTHHRHLVDIAERSIAADTLFVHELGHEELAAESS